VVGLAASAGGLRALREILSALPRDFPAAVVVVQHISPRHKSLLPEILGRRTRLPVKEAEEGDRLYPGMVFVAPPDRHVVVNPDRTLSLSQTGRVHHVRPSADILFASLAVSWQGRAVAVVLSGGDDDDATGVRLVKAMGGAVVAQDETSAEHFAMPRAAIATGAVDHVLPAAQIAAGLEHLVKEGWGAGKPKYDPGHGESNANGCKEAGPHGHCAAGTRTRAIPRALRST
jgi:two-component system chemotaxis response regulator CheB